MRLNTNLLPNTDTVTDGADTDYYVLGGGHLGLAVARQLRTAGHAVTLVDEAVDATDVPSVTGDPSAVDVLCDTGMSKTSTVVVATPNDARNLLVAQLVRTRFDVGDVFVVVHAPDRLDPVADAGHEPICATTVLADAVVADVGPRLTELDAA